MNYENIKIAEQYYEGWETKNRLKLKLFSGMIFKSPESQFGFADEFLKACWHLAGMKLENKRFISEGNTVVVRYEITSPDGIKRSYCEWMILEGGEIREIQVFYGSL